MESTELCSLARKWHTDKTKTPDNSLSHNYTPYYHDLLKDRRSTVMKVLEIGLGWAGLMHSYYPSAGSLLMWQDYFPNAQIYGVDIRPDTLRNENRIHSFLGDQSNEESLRKIAEQVGGDLDLIVDDGSHIPVHQVLTVKILFDLLVPGGLYVIEDVHSTAYLDTTELDYVRTHLSYPYEVIEVENETLPDDRLIVLRA